MSQLLRMHQIKRIIELYQQGRSIWETKRLTGLSRNTVREYLRRIQGSGLSPVQLLALDDESLKPIVYADAFEHGHGGRKVDTRYQTIEKNLARYCSELRRRGVTRQLLWEEYRNEYPGGYAYSQFCEHLYMYVEALRSQFIQMYNSVLKLCISEMLLFSTLVVPS